MCFSNLRKPGQFSPADPMAQTMAKRLTLAQARKVAPTNDRDIAIARIKAALKRRTGHSWSVTGGRGTAWGWIEVTTPPAHQRKHGRTEMSRGECIALARVLGLESVHNQGWSIPAGGDYRKDAVMRAEKGMSDVTPEQYWD